MLDGHVSLGGNVVTDPSLKLPAGAVIVLEPPPAVAAEPAGEDIPLDRGLRG